MCVYVPQLQEYKNAFLLLAYLFFFKLLTKHAYYI